MELMAAAAFGLEGLVKQELQELGFPAKAEQGGARFETDFLGAFKANLWLACADRVLWIIGEKTVTSFEGLFDFVVSLPWEDILPRDARFPVGGNCVRSQLMSVSDCQSITKKAIVERLKRKHKVSWFPETGSLYPITISIHRDLARVTIDTSGDALNKRGYRTWVGEAPLRETLAAALVRLSPWQPAQTLVDPCCGSGTLLVEAAFLAMNRAPGLARSFAMEQWAQADIHSLTSLRKEARQRFMPDAVFDIRGSDISAEALALCQKHLRQANLQHKIKLEQKDLRELRLELDKVCFLTNPPYGERLGDQKEAASLARSLGGLLRAHKDATLCAITPDRRFEEYAKTRASQRRRLYNGRLECEFLVMRNPVTA